jgi:hypothetical protein
VCLVRLDNQAGVDRAWEQEKPEARKMPAACGLGNPTRQEISVSTKHKLVIFSLTIQICDKFYKEFIRKCNLFSNSEYFMQQTDKAND